MKNIQLLLFVYLFLPAVCVAQSYEQKLKNLEENLSKTPQDTSAYVLCVQISELYKEKNPAKQLEYLKKGLEFTQKSKFTEYITEAYSKIALFYVIAREPDNAINACQQSIKYGKIISERKLNPIEKQKILYNVTSAYVSLAGAYIAKNNLEKGYENCLIAIENGEKLTATMLKSKLFVTVYNNIGAIYRRQKLYDKAIEYHQKAMQEAQKVNDEQGMGNAYSSIGNIYRLQKIYDKAIIYHQKSVEIAKKTNAKNLEAVALYNLAEDYLNTPQDLDKMTPEDLEKIKKAEGIYMECSVISKELQNEFMIGNSYLRMGRCALLTENFQNAEKYYEEALVIAKKINNTDMMLNAYENLIPTYAKLKKSDKIIESLEMFNQLSIKYTDEQNQKNLSELQTKYETKQKEQKITLLGREKRIQSLEIEKNIFEIRNKDIALDFADLENLRKQDTIQLKNLSLEKNATEIAFQKAGNEAKAQEIALKNAEIQNANLQKIILGVSALALLGVALFVFSRFRLARAKHAISEQKLVQERQQADILRIQTILDTQETERSRIADELHDGLGAEISSLKMMSEKIAFKYQNEPLIQENLAKLSSKSKQTVDTMRQIVWAMGENNNQLEDLVHYLQDYAHLYLNENSLKISFQSPKNYENKTLTFDQRHNVFLTFKEVLHNIVKHAHAQNVNISIKIDKNILILIQDDGIGIAPEKISKFGNGLKNLQKRMKAITGAFEIQAYLPTGTQAQILMPLNI